MSGRIRAALRRWATVLHSTVRYAPWLRQLAALCFVLRALVPFTPRERRLWLLSEAYRLTESHLLERYLEHRLEPWLEPPASSVWRDQRIGWERYREQELDDPRLVKSLVLKPPLPDGEPGVMYVSFAVNWLRILRHADLEGILREYLLVGATSYSPPDYRALWALDHLGPRPCFFQVSNPADLGEYTRLSDDIVELPIMACDWVNPDDYDPRPTAERTYDIAMVAGWARLKRHWLLFDALRRMERPLRVVLIGQDMEGGTADSVYELAKAYGVHGQVEMVRDATHGEVAGYLSDSRVSLVLSRREGSSVVVTESFFADTPVGVMEGAHIGSAAYINADTGIRMRRRTMAGQLSRFVDRAGDFAPREWAAQRVSCFRSTRRLNAILKEHCLAWGVPWTRDIVPMCWRPNPEYVDPEDERSLRPAYAQLRRRYGLRFRADTPGGDLASG